MAQSTFANKNEKCMAFSPLLRYLVCSNSFTSTYIGKILHLLRMHDTRILVNAMNGITDAEQENIKIPNKNVF